MRGLTGLDWEYAVDPIEETTTRVIVTVRLINNRCRVKIGCCFALILCTWIFLLVKIQKSHQREVGGLFKSGLQTMSTEFLNPTNGSWWIVQIRPPNQSDLKL
jgi:hypothetical protein